ncbi:MAG: hypothetical protein ACE5F7_07765 [Nitrospiria bacterium]
MKEIGGCFLVFLGLLGLVLSIAISFSYYFLPVAFVIFICSLIMISYGLGTPRQGKEKKRKNMIEIGMWLTTSDGETLLIKKDANGYPDLVPINPDIPLEGTNAKKEKGKILYEELTGKKYPHPNATTRQVLWDFLEVAIQHLP